MSTRGAGHRTTPGIKRMAAPPLMPDHVGRLTLKEVLAMFEPVGHSKSSGPLWAAAVILAIMLAVTVMLALVYHYPMLESEAIALGLCVFFFTIFFDVFAIILLIGSEYRAGEGRAAIGLVGTFLLWGVLAASVMGLFAWLVTTNLWVSLWVFLLSPSVIMVWRGLRRRTA